MRTYPLAVYFTLGLLAVGFNARANTDLIESSASLQAEFTARGSLKSPSPAEAEWINDSLRRKMGAKEYQKYLNVAGWNSSGGGGGRACFGTAGEAAQALDRSGRMRREMIPRIQLLVPFDYYALLNTDYDLWTEMLNGREPHFRPIQRGEEPGSYLRRNVIQTYAARAPVFAETLIAVLNGLSFDDWQPVRGRGLPYYPDLTKGPEEAVKDRELPMAEHEETENRCVYVQLAIRYGGQFGPNDKPVHIVYDADLVDRMRALSGGPDDFTKKISILILHETLYFIVKRSSPYGGENVIQFIKDVLLNDFDAEYFRYSYFTRGRNLGRFMSLAMAENYDHLLLEDAKRDRDAIPRLTMFRAWYKHVFNAEIPEWAENAKGHSTIPYFGWSGLEFVELGRYLSDPHAQADLGPADAMASVLVSLSFNGILNSPEDVFTRSRSGKSEILRACAYYGDFTDGDLLTHVKGMKNQENPVTILKSTPEGMRAFFNLLRRFCRSSMGIDQIADRKFPSRTSTPE